MPTLNETTISSNAASSQATTSDDLAHVRSGANLESNSSTAFEQTHSPILTRRRSSCLTLAVLQHSSSSDLFNTRRSTRSTETDTTSSPYTIDTTANHQVPEDHNTEKAIPIIQILSANGTVFPQKPDRRNFNYQQYLSIFLGIAAHIHEASSFNPSSQVAASKTNHPELPLETDPSRIILFPPNSDRLQRATNRLFSFVYGTQTETQGAATPAQQAIFDAPATKLKKLYELRQQSTDICILLSHVCIDGKDICLISTSGFYKNGDEHQEKHSHTTAAIEAWAAFNEVIQYLNSTSQPGDLVYILSNRPSRELNLLIAAAHLSLANHDFHEGDLEREARINCAERSRDGWLVKRIEEYDQVTLLATRPYTLPVPNLASRSITAQAIPPCPTCMSQVLAIHLILRIARVSHLFINFARLANSCPFRVLITQLLVKEHQAKEEVWLSFHSQTDHSSQAEAQAYEKIATISQETDQALNMLLSKDPNDTTVLSPYKNLTQPTLPLEMIVTIGITHSLVVQITALTSVQEKINHLEKCIKAFKDFISANIKKYTQLANTIVFDVISKISVAALAIEVELRYRTLKEQIQLLHLLDKDESAIAEETKREILALQKALDQYVSNEHRPNVMQTPNSYRATAEALKKLVHSITSVIDSPLKKVKDRVVPPKKKELERKLQEYLQSQQNPTSTQNNHSTDDALERMGERLTSKDDFTVLTAPTLFTPASSAAAETSTVTASTTDNKKTYNIR